MERDRIKTVRKLTEGISLSYLGLGFNKAWVFLALPSFALVAASGSLPQAEDSAFLTGLYDAAFVASALALALISLKASPAGLRRVALPLSTGAMTAASLLLLTAQTVPAHAFWLVPSAVVMGAVGVMGLAALWADFYAAFDPLRSALLNAGAVIVMSLVCYAVAESTYPRTVILMIVLALLSGLCLIASYAKLPDKTARDARKPCKVVFPYKAAAFIAAYSFAYGLSSSLAIGDPQQPLLRAIPAMIIVLLAFANARKFSIKTLYNIAFPLMVCGLLLIALMPGLPAALPPAILEISYSTMGIMLILISCSISYSLGASASWIFCILVAIQLATRAAGAAVSNALASSAGNGAFDQVITIAAIVLIIVASIAMLSEKSIFSHWGAARVDADDPLALPEHVRLRVESLTAAGMLTQREREVLRLMALKRTTAQMAQEMFVAEGTVKAHVQHIYQKLDVHTRKELRALLGVDDS